MTGYDPLRFYNLYDSSLVTQTIKPANVLTKIEPIVCQWHIKEKLCIELVGPLLGLEKTSLWFCLFFFINGEKRVKARPALCRLTGYQIRLCSIS